MITIEGATRANFSDTLASYNNGSIGVKEKKSGTSCSQVNSANEQLRLSLGDGLQAMTSPSTRASSAYLDLELKQSARIVATLSLNGTQTGSYELQSGASVGLPTSTGSPAFVCSAGADSGPDSGVNDNCRWPISMPSWTGADDGVFFDAITLKALSGSFSLEGGGDGIVLPQSPTSTPNASIIEVVDGVIECGGKTRTEAANGDEPEVTVYRLDNADGSPCSAVPYALSNSYAAARFLKPLGTQTSAQFIWDLTWLMPPTPGSSDLPDVTIDYETGVPTRVALGWCPDATYAPDGTFHGYDANQVAALPDQDEYPGSQFACLIARHATSTALSPDKVQVHDLVYVLGDAKMQW
ncbi:MAG: hypothetical protein ABIU87_06105 [Ornithinibacter sp.]